MSVNSLCSGGCGRWYCEICQKIYKGDEVCPHYLIVTDNDLVFKWVLGLQGGTFWTCTQCRAYFAFGESCPHFWSCTCNSRRTVGQPDGGNDYWSCALCQKQYPTATSHCEHCWCMNGVYSLDVKTDNDTWFCELCNDGAGRYMWGTGDTCEHYRWCTVCDKRHRTDEVCPKADPNVLKNVSKQHVTKEQKKVVDPFDDEENISVFHLEDLFRLKDEKESSDVSPVKNVSAKKPTKLFEIQKCADKLSRNKKPEERPILRKLLERNERIRQAKANEGICEHPKHEQPSPKQCPHASNGYAQSPVKKPLGIHVKSRINLRKISDDKQAKPKNAEQAKFPKIELKRSKPSNFDKYPLLTQSYIRYSKEEDPKDPSPKPSRKSSRNGSDSNSDKSDDKKGRDGMKSRQPSRADRPVLQYNINVDALRDDIRLEPLAISGLSNLGKAAEMRENSRLAGLKLQLQQASNVQSSLKHKEDGFSVVPPMSKVIKSGKEKKENNPFSLFGNPTPKPRSSFHSSNSDSEKSETPKRSPKGSKVYTNNPSRDLRKSVLKKTYKEDEGHETPSDSQSGSKFSLLKSSKNKNAAPNASGARPTLTKLPSASDESQHIGFKTIKGSKGSAKEDTSKLNDVTPTPKGDTPNGETQKGDTPKSDAKDKKSDGSSSSDEDKKSKRSESRSSHKSQTSKSEKNDASDEDKKSSHSKSSKSSSKKSVKTYSHDSHSEKHSDGEVSKSDKGSDKEGKSSEHNESSEEENEHSEEEDENSKEESESFETSEK